MKKYTQNEFDNFPKNEYGVKICPKGDYNGIAIKGEWCSFGEGCSFGEWCSFGKRCSFGEWCSFGEGCSFGEWCSFGEGCKYMTFVFATLTCLFGLFKYPIYIYHNKDKYIISAGCENFDNLDKAVKKTKEQNCYCEKTHRILKIMLDE